MKNDEIANLKDSIENTIDNIPETMQAEYEAYLTNELKDIALDLLLLNAMDGVAAETNNDLQ